VAGQVEAALGGVIGGGHVYLHHFLRSDEDVEDLHSHPWPAHAYILAGGYVEERRVEDPASTIGYRVVGERYFRPGAVNVIAPDTFHRVDLLERDAWSLCVTGPKRVLDEGEAAWSFWNRETGKTTPWREFIEAAGLTLTPTPTDLVEAFAPGAAS
jgi:hypothetical protein